MRNAGSRFREVCIRWGRFFTMRIVTYNIHGWRTEDGQPNEQLVADTLSSIGADIIGLNEVFFPRAMPGSGQPSLSWLAGQLNMAFVFGPCMRWPAEDKLPADAYGNALLSRWPITANASHLLSPVPGKHQRGLLEGRVLLPDNGTLTVYVTHLDHTDEDARLQQLRALRSWTTRDRNRPHVVMGDFNAVSSWDLQARPDVAAALREHPKGQNLVPEDGPSVVSQMEKAGYVDTFRQFGRPGARSLIPPDTAIRIDYIFVSQPMADAVQNCIIWEEPSGEEASDHRAVVADVQL